MQKQERQAQIETLQEWVAKVLAQEEAAKTYIEQIHAECVRKLSDQVVV